MNPKVIKTITYSKISLDFYDNNAIMFKLDNKAIDWFYSLAKTKKQTIDTRSAKRTSIQVKKDRNKALIDVFYKQKDLKLIQHFEIEKNKNYFTIQLIIQSDKTIESNYLVPLDFIYPLNICNELFLSLEEKILLVPYDNDMWIKYEATYLRPGRTSYDVTAIFDDKNNNGLIIGALDFDTWKNAIKCSAYDARAFYALSGIADENTHDHLEHGYLKAKQIKSSRFICGFYNDVRLGLQEYSKLCVNPNGIYKWKHGVPFGWNSYSALTLETKIENVRSAADFIYQLDNFKTKNNHTYINFDAVINIKEKDIKKLIDDLHARNQKVGWYMNPLSHLSIQDKIPLLGSKNKTRKDILLKNIDGTNYPKIDDKYPIDITIPEAEKDFRLYLRWFVDMGFDYIKLDFLSHGALEGKYHNKNIKTGRQALMYFYNIVKEELDPRKINKEIFISSSIDPLFPNGYSHSRRSSCDAFGHIEDVRYVLNSLTYSYWTNNTLYQFNDPDHTVLYHSLVDQRSTTSLAEARSRYNASVISGTVMLLSDDYGPNNTSISKNAKTRALKLANNKQLNELARLNIAFTPITLTNTSNVFYTKNYFAVFNYEDKDIVIEIDPKDIKFKKQGTLLNLNNNKTLKYKDKIKIKLNKHDSYIFKCQ